MNEMCGTMKLRKLLKLRKLMKLRKSRSFGGRYRNYRLNEHKSSEDTHTVQFKDKLFTYLISSTIEYKDAHLKYWNYPKPHLQPNSKLRTLNFEDAPAHTRTHTHTHIGNQYPDTQGNVDPLWHNAHVNNTTNWIAYQFKWVWFRML